MSQEQDKIILGQIVEEEFKAVQALAEQEIAEQGVKIPSWGELDKMAFDAVLKDTQKLEYQAGL